MKLTKILTIVFFLTSIGLAYYLYSRIKGTIDEEARIKRIEAKVIDRLVMIRKAQKAYQSVNREYAKDWDKLIDFIQNGTFYIIERTEEIITLEYGADTSIFHYDTLGTVPVIDSLFSAEKHPDLDLKNLTTIPESGGKIFDLFTDKVEKSGVLVNVIEVRDVSPANPIRKEKNEARNKKPLRFGSRTDVTTAGNWE